MAKAEELQKASQTQKDDKIVSFDCRVRPKDELTGWIRNHKPSEMKKSDKIGYLMVLSKRLTSGMAICNVTQSRPRETGRIPYKDLSASHGLTQRPFLYNAKRRVLKQL